MTNIRAWSGYKLFDIGRHSIKFESIIEKKYFEEKSADDKKHEQLPRKQSMGAYPVTHIYISNICTIYYAKQLHFWIWRFCVHSVYQSRLLIPWKTVWTKIRPDKSSSLIMIQTVSFYIWKNFLKKGCFEKINRHKKAWKLPRQVLKTDTEAWRFV